jgi:hypothetical protein
LVEIEHWISLTSTGTDDISTTRTSFIGSLRTNTWSCT